jgi:hypothetical protein
MKTLIIFLLASSIAFAQTREPQQKQITLNGVSQYLSSDSAYFQLNQFMFGWHWGAMLKIGEATHSNMNDMSTEWGYNHYKADNFNSDINLFVRASYQDFRKKCYFT